MTYHTRPSMVRLSAIPSWVKPFSTACGLSVMILMLSSAFAPDASAAGAPTVGALNNIVEFFNGRVRAFEASLARAATDLFLILAGIEFSIAVGRQLIGRADLFGILATVFHQMFVLGFFYWLLIHGPDMNRAIVQSFAIAGNDAVTAAGGSANQSPSDVFNGGIALIKVMWANLSFSILGILLVIAGLIVCWIFAKISGMLVEVIIESYFVASTSVILLGFGGSGATRDIAIAQFRMAIAVGVKRMVLQLLIGLGDTIVRGWAEGLATMKLDYITVATVIGAPMVLLRLVETLPQRAQDMMSGSYLNMGPGLGNVPSAAAAAAGTMAAGMAGGAAAGAAAFKMASAQIAAREASGGGSSSSGGIGGTLSRGAQIAGGAVKNLASAAGSDFSQRMTGSYSAQHGNSGFRMASAMNKGAAASRQEAKDAQAGNGQSGKQ